MRSSLQSVDKEDWAWLTGRFCMICWHQPKVDSCSTVAILWDISEGEWWREVFTLGRMLSNTPGCSLCLEGEIAIHMITYWVMGCGQWFGWMVRDLEGTSLKNWWQQTLRKRYMIDFSGKKAWRYLCSMWMLTTVWLQQKRILIIKWRGWPVLCIVRLSVSTSVVFQCVYEQSGLGGREGSYT